MAEILHYCHWEIINFSDTGPIKIFELLQLVIVIFVA